MELAAIVFVIAAVVVAEVLVFGKYALKGIHYSASVNKTEVYEGDILAEKECPEFEVGYINCTFAAAYVGDDKFIFNLVALSEVCTVYGNKFDRKEGEK